MSIVMNEVDVFGLFGALYKNGQAKLSDHFINTNSEEKTSCQKK